MIRARTIPRLFRDRTERDELRRDRFETIGNARLARASCNSDQATLRIMELLDRDGPGTAATLESAEVAELVFVSFFRIDASAARDTGSAGPGLPVVGAVAHVHGGAAGYRLTKVPTRGSGSSFQPRRSPP